MKVNKCPKCGSTKIKREELHMLGKWVSTPRFDVYVCQACGYSEFYWKVKRGRK